MRLVGAGTALVLAIVTACGSERLEIALPPPDAAMTSLIVGMEAAGALSLTAIDITSREGLSSLPAVESWTGEPTHLTALYFTDSLDALGLRPGSLDPFVGSGQPVPTADETFGRFAEGEDFGVWTKISTRPGQIEQAKVEVSERCASFRAETRILMPRPYRWALQVLERGSEVIAATATVGEDPIAGAHAGPARFFRVAPGVADPELVGKIPPTPRNYVQEDVAECFGQVVVAGFVVEPWQPKLWLGEVTGEFVALPEPPEVVVELGCGPDGLYGLTQRASVLHLATPSGEWRRIFEDPEEHRFPHFAHGGSIAVSEASVYVIPHDQRRVFEITEGRARAVPIDLGPEPVPGGFAVERAYAMVVLGSRVVVGTFNGLLYELTGERFVPLALPVADEHVLAVVSRGRGFVFSGYWGRIRELRPGKEECATPPQAFPMHVNSILALPSDSFVFVGDTASEHQDPGRAAAVFVHAD
ncbi:MAG: hypothetical protein HY791_09850 [Deltaproteobacteria bacterium]|nr:hypothetical protein [Deltaproteobacteria bacterium]